MVTYDLGFPTPSQLYDPLLIVLGRFTDFQAGRDVHIDRAFFPTLELYGIDEDYRNAYDNAGLLYAPVNKRYSLVRVYQLAFRYMRKTVNGEKRARCFQERDGYYRLTPFGTEIAWDRTENFDGDLAILDKYGRPSDKPPSPVQNLTLEWFQENWKRVEPRVYEHLVRRLPKSHKQDLIYDHMYKFVERKISLDSFHKHLAGGGKLYPSLLSKFIAKSAFSEIRTWGSDASCRAIRGARNDRDYRKMQEFREEHPNYFQEKVFSREHQRSFNGSGRVLYDGTQEEKRSRRASVVDCVSSHENVDAMMNMTMTMDNIVRTLDKKLNGQGEAHFEVFMLKEVEGVSYKAIAEELKISKVKATAMAKRAHSVIREAHASGELELG